MAQERKRKIRKLVFGALLVLVILFVLYSLLSCIMASAMRNMYTYVNIHKTISYHRNAPIEQFTTELKSKLQRQNLLEFCTEINVYEDVVVIKIKNDFVQSLYRGDYDYIVAPYDRENE